MKCRFCGKQLAKWSEKKKECVNCSALGSRKYKVKNAN